jgi:recombinational DNA repair protein (RecF pathway)
LYRLGSSMTEAIAAGVPVEPLARYFEYWLLRLQGVYPSLGSCAGCAEPLLGGAVLPPRDDLFLCRTCAPAGGTSVSVDALRFLKAAGATAPERLHALRLAPRAARELETLHRRLLHLHLEKELKSARVLREMRHAR